MLEQHDDLVFGYNGFYRRRILRDLLCPDRPGGLEDILGMEELDLLHRSPVSDGNRPLYFSFPL